MEFPEEETLEEELVLLDVLETLEDREELELELELDIELDLELLELELLKLEWEELIADDATEAKDDLDEDELAGLDEAGLLDELVAIEAGVLDACDVSILDAVDVELLED